jgi:hypothetical protein
VKRLKLYLPGSGSAGLAPSPLTTFLTWFVPIMMLLIALPTFSQAPKVLHSFDLVVDSVNSEGACPEGTLVLSGNILYTDGSGFRTLYSFTGGADGGDPMGNLTVASNVLYGTTWSGGADRA